MAELPVGHSVLPLRSDLRRRIILPLRLRVSVVSDLLLLRILPPWHHPSYLLIVQCVLKIQLLIGSNVPPNFLNHMPCAHINPLSRLRVTFLLENQCHV